ncbi:hypothetical protein V6C03_14595 [Methyloligella sp. 2.7D]|uniref:hypothetical protein n=1 Tax=unclassified Methyloligella TaxID=2625955 RepID=UPI00157CC4F3|nr:hypothetical protein [Methyloligella sp. GL2]QKP77019.1 hypothetical protein HT051_05870 [Methyloligella sp. GL2]
MEDTNRVTIKDIDIPFWRIVAIMIKWSIAAIPAMIALLVIYTAVVVVVAMVLAMFGVELPTETIE